MTLEEMYNETAMYIGEVLQKEGNLYIGESITLTNIFKSAINYVYKKICREKYNLETTENITSGQALTKKLYKVKSVNIEGEAIPYILGNNTIEFDYDSADVNYFYIPSNLTNLTDIPELPEELVDHKILCYYAAFQYFNIEDDERAVKWLSMWEDGFKSIDGNRVYQTQVELVYDGGW